MRMDLRINGGLHMEKNLNDQRFDTSSKLATIRHLSCPGFPHRIQFSVVKLIVSLTVSTFVILAYFILQTEYLPFARNAQHFSERGQEVPESRVLLVVDSDTKLVPLTSTTKEDEARTSFKPVDDRTIRRKRHVQNRLDCGDRKEECEFVLSGVQDVRGAMFQNMDQFRHQLVQQGVLEDSDPLDSKFRKIIECLQCKDPIINHYPELHDVRSESYAHGVNIHDHGSIDNIVPSLHDHVNSDVIESKNEDTRRRENSRDRETFHAEKNSRTQFGYQMMRSAKTTPLIVPTAETTRTSQNIQFTPGNSWRSIPVCFYGPPLASSPNSLDQSAIPVFRTAIHDTPEPSELVEHSDQWQQIRHQQRQQLASTETDSPTMAAPPSQSPLIYGGSQQFFQQPSRDLPYHCIYASIPPNEPARQPVPQSNKALQSLTSELLIKPKPIEELNTAPTGIIITTPSSMTSSSESSKKEINMPQDEDLQNSNNAALYSKEKSLEAKGDGFWCHSPYKKHLSVQQRCDGRVDCPGAEDESECPSYSGYYSRFIENQVERGNLLANDEVARVENQEVESTTNNRVFAATGADLPRHFVCKRIIQTIAEEKWCDNVHDCEDASDEESCTCKDYIRRDHSDVICDGHVDCDDGSDEEGCNTCGENQYRCHRSGTCIPKHKQCDQTMDCKLNEDELDCFALTDGKYINLDMDGRPHLNIEGMLTQYDENSWHLSCFKSEFRDVSKRIEAGQKICNYLGYRNMEYTQEVVLKSSQLIEKRPQATLQVDQDRPDYGEALASDMNKTCYGLKIRCKPILDRKVNAQLNVDSASKERRYMWPWEASIFVDGDYHCSAVLLENNLLLTSQKCKDGIDLTKNSATALLGVSFPEIPLLGPYRQLSPIADIIPVENSDALLLRLRDRINMTRYVQPLYVEKRFFPASIHDVCFAVGINGNSGRKVQYLETVVDGCPKCHRCFREKKGDQSLCTVKNENRTWSGNVVCLSEEGWYPAAVFEEKPEDCGFASVQVLSSIDYIHAHLSQAIDESSPKSEEPDCEGMRCSLGKCISWNRICDGIHDCHDGADESSSQCTQLGERCQNDIMECRCPISKLRCGNGECIPKEMFCDGKDDCPDGADEPEICSCGEYMKLSDPKHFCDGRRHCLDKTDEDYKQCLCRDSSFRCHMSSYNGTTPCISQDFVCDGEADCPNGEDEMDSNCWTIKSTHENDPKGHGEVMIKSFGTWHSKCFPRPVKSQREVTNVCTRLGFTSGILINGNKVSESQFMARNDFYMFQLNNYTWLTKRRDDHFGVWKKPLTTCYRLFVHCFE